MMEVPGWWSGDVSRETLQKLQDYAALMRKWSPKINLVSRSSLPEIEERHIWDSAQLYIGRHGRWVDFGSGGGLPGVVISILSQANGSESQVTLVESDQRKAAFLRTCARELDLPMVVYANRIEILDPLEAQTISARALASLDVLLRLSAPHLTVGGLCVFQKGARWKSEIAEAQQNWRFSYDVMPSKTNLEAVVLKVKDITRV